MDRGEEEPGLPKTRKAPISNMAPIQRARPEVFGQAISNYLTENPIVAEGIELRWLDT